MTDIPHPSARYDDRAQSNVDAFQDEALPKVPLDRNMIRMLVDLVDSARLLCPAQPGLLYAGTPEAHLIYRKAGPPLAVSSRVCTCVQRTASASTKGTL